MKWGIAYLLLLISFLGNSQDKLFYLDGKIIDVKVNEIGDSQITFKKWGNLEGPDYTVNISEIEKIVFENGFVEAFNKKESDHEERNSANAKTKLDSIQAVLDSNKVVQLARKLQPIYASQFRIIPFHGVRMINEPNGSYSMLGLSSLYYQKAGYTSLGARVVFGVKKWMISSDSRIHFLPKKRFNPNIGVAANLSKYVLDVSNSDNEYCFNSSVLLTTGFDFRYGKKWCFFMDYGYGLMWNMPSTLNPHPFGYWVYTSQFNFGLSMLIANDKKLFNLDL